MRKKLANPSSTTSLSTPVLGVLLSPCEIIWAFFSKEVLNLFAKLLAIQFFKPLHHFFLRNVRGSHKLDLRQK